MVYRLDYILDNIVISYIITAEHNQAGAGQSNMTVEESEKRQTPIIVRGVDRRTYIEARKAALDRGITIGKWINEAIEEKLRIDPRDQTGP